jgi:hypothetical protein
MISVSPGLVRLVIGLAVLALVSVAPGGAQAAHEPDLGPTTIPLIPGYHEDATITVFVRATGNLPDDALPAVQDAIATWNAAIAHNFGPVVQFADITATASPAEANHADVVLHLKPSGGNRVGVAMFFCAAPDCPEITNRVQVDAGAWNLRFDYELVYSIALHELGHVLLLGHADNEADVMYPFVGAMTLSVCDLEAFAAAWEWVLEGEAPHPPSVDAVTCP